MQESMVIDVSASAGTMQAPAGQAVTGLDKAACCQVHQLTCTNDRESAAPQLKHAEHTHEDEDDSTDSQLNQSHHD